MERTILRGPAGGRSWETSGRAPARSASSVVSRPWIASRCTSSRRTIRGCWRTRPSPSSNATVRRASATSVSTSVKPRTALLSLLPHEQILLNAVPEQERAVHVEAAHQLVDLRRLEARTGALQGRAAVVDELLRPVETEPDRLRRDRFVVPDQRQDLRARPAGLPQARRQVRQLLARQVVEQVPGEDHVELRTVGERDQLLEELRSQLLPVRRRHPRHEEVLDRQPAAELGEVLHVRADGRAEVQDVRPGSPRQGSEDRGESEGTMNFGLGPGLDRRRDRMRRLSAGGAERKPAHPAACTATASGTFAGPCACPCVPGAFDRPESFASMSMLPLKREPSSSTTRGAEMLPRIAPDWRRSACSCAKTLPSTSPSTITSRP